MRIFAIPEGLRLPYVRSPIITAGANEQQPRQETVSSVNSLSGVVSPVSIARNFCAAAVMSPAPLTCQAVPWQTRIRCLPTGFRRNCA